MEKFEQPNRYSLLNAYTGLDQGLWWLSGVRKDSWLVTRSDSESYSGYFAELLNGQALGFDETSDVETNYLQQLVDIGREELGEFNVLDLMSYGAFNRLSGVTGMAVGLTDKRNKYEKEFDSKNNITFVKQDLKDPKAWSRIKEVADQKQMKFDLILCRPMGGIRHMPRTRNSLLSYFENCYDLLNKDHGILLTQIPSIFYPDMARISSIISLIPGIDAVSSIRRGSINFMLKRTLEAPDSLKAQ